MNTNQIGFPPPTCCACMLDKKQLQAKRNEELAAMDDDTPTANFYTPLMVFVGRTWICWACTRDACCKFAFQARQNSSESEPEPPQPMAG